MGLGDGSFDTVSRPFAGIIPLMVWQNRGKLRFVRREDAFWLFLLCPRSGVRCRILLLEKL